MAQIFGIEEEEYNELPETVKNSLKAADAANQATEARLKKIEEGLAPKEPEPVVVAPTKWNPPVSDMDEMNYDNRMDVIIMGFKSSNDAMTRTCLASFEDEVRDNLKKSHPFQRSQQTYVKTIIDLVAGRHLAEITQDIRSGGSKFNSLFTESGGSGGGNSNIPPKTATEQLTPEERAMADKLNVSHEIFLESRG